MLPLSNAVKELTQRCFGAAATLGLRSYIYCLSLSKHGRFQYKPLAPRALRLLTILPPLTTRHDEPIRCLLSHPSFDDFTNEYEHWERKTGNSSRDDPYKARLGWAQSQDIHSVDTESLHRQHSGLDQARMAPRYSWGDYVALSYCWSWGDKPSFRNILINGRRMQVTETLEAALRFYRNLQGLGKRVLLWADAIGINQEDEDEKLREIGRMKEIYAGSTCVVVHLGPEDQDTNRALDVIQRTAADVLRDQGTVRRFELLHNVFTPDPPRSHPPLTRDIVCLLGILCRPYWRRLWILQEIAMGDKSLIVGCGDSIVQLTDLLLAAKFTWHNLENMMAISGDQLKYLKDLNGSLWVLLFFDKLQDVQRRFGEPGRVPFLDLQLPLLNLGQNALSSKPHDKVFGLLGILPEEIGSAMDKYRSYRIPATDLFVAFTRAIIEYTGTLDVILTRNYEQKGIPSWAIDWTLQSDRVSFVHDWTTYGYDHFVTAYPNLREMVDIPYHARADGHKTSSFKICDKTLLLTCSALRIGKVDGLAPAISRACEPSPPSSTLQPTINTSPYGDETATAQALLHTLFANPAWGDSAASSLFRIPWMSGDYYNKSQHDEDFTTDESWQQKYMDMATKGWAFCLVWGNFLSFEFLRRRIGHFHVGGRRFQDYFEQDVKPCYIPEDRVRLDLAKVVGMHLSRRLITLETGHFGLAPGKARRGDEVFVVVGCCFPVVLRRKPYSDHYEIVGECYIEGFARGEALEMFDTQEITIC
ncbi:HET-domain-containing protein [Corynespora cassiicola Philippines]|uniref:HET-domain-containing protein n=1 Tax=Corynespora cassiicola Philippines TaxID=1448308 RepID=A0A2T2NIZ5_CORCC|nr:HET-domain-containing protein [Corynespora cassiicola Philippines]